MRISARLYRPALQIAFAFGVVVFAGILTFSQGKSPSDCFEVKHLDFFGIDKIELSWPDSEIEGLLTTSPARAANQSRFLTPMIVKQLAEYHSCVKKRTDLERFHKLTQLYLQLRPGITDKLHSLSFTDQQLDLIRRDFYQQVNDDRLLPELIYSMDDGPLLGEAGKSMPEGGRPTVLPTRFGTVKLIQVKERVYAGAYDKNDRPLWIRILKGTVPERYLKNFDSKKIELSEFEAVGVVAFFVDGERLRIYFRPDGRFLFYLHSW